MVYAMFKSGQVFTHKPSTSINNQLAVSLPNTQTSACIQRSKGMNAHSESSESSEEVSFSDSNSDSESPSVDIINSSTSSCCSPSTSQ